MTELRPLVTVAVPSYRRPLLVRRAIASVRRQTLEDWELVVSDDEDPPGETWEALQALQREDARIRPVRSSPRHGQVANTNNALLAARGEWIKLLHDDDVLLPHCLETLVRSVRGLPGVAIVSSLAVHFRGETELRRDREGAHHRELILQAQIPLAMYLQEAGPGEPSRVMVHRRVVEAGTLFEDLEGLVSAIDSYWNLRASVHGDLLLVNEHLVELHDDDETVTKGVGREALDREYEILREQQLRLIDPSLDPPSLETVMGMMRLIRAATRAKSRHLGEAVRLAGSVRSPRAWLLASRWAVRQVLPGRLSTVKRIVPPDDGEAQRVASIR